jgi:hypothetical protein
LQNGLLKGEIMPAITIKNVPTELYEDIKKSASKNLRSINNEIIFRLKKTLYHRKPNPNQLISKIDKINSIISLPALNDDFIANAKNQGRE